MESAAAGRIVKKGLPTPVKEKYLIVGGNVLVTVSDRKWGIDANSDGTVDYYNPDVLSTQCQGS